MNHSQKALLFISNVMWVVTWAWNTWPLWPLRQPFLHDWGRVTISRVFPWKVICNKRRVHVMCAVENNVTNTLISEYSIGTGALQHSARKLLRHRANNPQNLSPIMYSHIF